MIWDYDAAKCTANIAKHGLSFADFAGFDNVPVYKSDRRHDYGEERYWAFGRINGLGHCLVFTVARGRVRLISFRRAHEKEMKRHE